MRRSLPVLGAAVLFSLGAVMGVSAQEAPGGAPGSPAQDASTGRRHFQRPPDDSSLLEELFPRFKDRALVLEINARVLERNQVEVWSESHEKVTIPGRPVGLKLVGANVVVAVQFTPYLRRGQNLLVAQGQIWMEAPGQGIRYYTSMQTIPVEFNEPVYFFPLGSTNRDDNARIEVMLTMKHYSNAETPLEENPPE